MEEVLHFNQYRKDPIGEVEATIELGKVVGTDHASYNKGNWLQMQRNLLHHARHTVEQYVDMVRNPGSYSSGHDPVVVRQYEVCQSGNHRVCHARFAGLSHIRARAQQCVIDPARAALESANGPVPSSPAAKANGWLTPVLRLLALRK